MGKDSLAQSPGGDGRRPSDGHGAPRGRRRSVHAVTRRGGRVNRRVSGALHPPQGLLHTPSGFGRRPPVSSRTRTTVTGFGGADGAEAPFSTRCLGGQDLAGQRGQQVHVLTGGRRRRRAAVAGDARPAGDRGLASGPSPGSHPRARSRPPRPQCSIRARGRREADPCTEPGSNNGASVNFGTRGLELGPPAPGSGRRGWRDASAPECGNPA